MIRFVPAPRRLALAAALALASTAVAAANGYTASPDHLEFGTDLDIPFRAADGYGRQFELEFSYPDAQDDSRVLWRVEIVDAQGRSLRSWEGVDALRAGKPRIVTLDWDARDAAGQRLAPGFYEVLIAAAKHEPALVRGLRGPLPKRVDAALQHVDGELFEQSVSIVVGAPPKVAMPAFAGLPRAGETAKGQSLTGGLPYTVYYGNLHSQTNHSDGGDRADGALCQAAQSPQKGKYGPDYAFAYARQNGLEFMLASEHNHNFDGNGTTENPAANAAAARALYASGEQIAASFNAANPGFVALYGVEWGYTTAEGHLNILNANQLPGWERNSAGELVADVLTPRGDYVALYSAMKQRGWIGQFNHPASDQFPVGSTALGYHADGDEVMVAAEIHNSKGLSSATDETATTSTTFESQFKKLLSAGYHLAPTSNQDNHCANWGNASTYRTGVLLPTGAALNEANLIAALKARRVFASNDKNSQIVLTGNGQVMGSRISNSGPLTLDVLYANSAGRSVSKVEVFEGVPRSNGSVTLLSSTASTTLTPGLGEHFYYAKLTQDDGKRLWSAPIWVTQTAASVDNQPPTVSAAVSGSSATISLSATATDNVGVSRVEFRVDGSLVGSDSSAPFALALDSTTLGNGSHSLIATAFDAAGNSAPSSAVSFSVNNVLPDTSAPSVSAAVSGSSGSINLSAIASDNVGVTRVDFEIDGVVRGSDSGAPYALAFNSTVLADGSHALVARAFDAAGNSAPSASVNFSTSNAPPSSVFSEQESNASIAGANVVARSFSSIRGTMGTTTDKDVFATSLGANETLAIAMTGPSGSSYDYDLQLLDAAGAVLVESAGDTANEALSYRNGASARSVYARVNSYKGSSSTLTYTLALTYTASTVAVEQIKNGSFEAGSVDWTASSGVITNDSQQAARGGSWKAWLNGYGSAHTDSLQQTVSIPAGASQATLNLWLKVVTEETGTTALDTLKLQLKSSTGTVLTTLATWSNRDAGSSYVQRSFDLSGYKGQTLRLYVEGVENSSRQTSFVIDDVSLVTR